MDIVVNNDEVIPSGILQAQSKHHSYCTGASQGRWNCLGTQLLRSEDDTIQYSFFVWYTPPLHHHSQQKQDDRNKAIPFVKLEHSKLAAKFMDGSDETPPQPLLALHTTTTNTTTDSGVWIYMANPVTGALVVWRLSREDLKRPLAPPNAALVTIPIRTATEQEELPGALSSPPDQLTSLDVSSSSSTSTTASTSMIPVIILGSRQGGIYHVKQTQIPIALHVQKVQPSTITGGGGLLTRYLWGSSSSDVDSTTAQAMAVTQQSPIVTNLMLRQQSLEQQQQLFVSITQAGYCVIWKMTPTESHRALFEALTILSLSEAVPIAGSSLEQIQVLGATWNEQTHQLHVLLYAFMTPTDQDVANHTTATTTSRLYWARLNVGVSAAMATHLTVSQVTWLNGFADPHNDVLLTGFTATDNGLTYAVFCVEPDQNDTLYPAHYIRLGTKKDQHLTSSVAHSTVVMVMDDNQDHTTTNDHDIHEGNVMIPHRVVTLLPGTMSKDVATHGVSLWDATGVKLRIRWRKTAAVSSSPSRTSTRTSRATMAKKLQLHLQAVFWESYTHPDRELRLPPSLTMADPSDLEQAIVELARQLQRSSSSASSTDDTAAAARTGSMMPLDRNPLEWHLALVELLQQAGIYRTLSLLCRWKLLAIGQEVCAFWALWCDETMSEAQQWEQAYRAQLVPDGVAPWLQGVQASILAQPGGADREIKLLDWFCTAVWAAMKYRNERASECYDVDSTLLPKSESPQEVPVWTCSSSLLAVWDQQLAKWMRGGLSGTASPKVVETMAACVLQARRDVFSSCPNEATKKAYVRDQTEAFKLLRSVSDWRKDKFTFDLCTEHCFFGGLCDIALDHEKRGDRVLFSLDPLFEKLKGKTDVGTGMEFGLYVLKWHVRWNLPGHVLKYGEHCPNDLNVLMNTESSLQPYKWIHSVRRGDYENAASALVDHVNSGGLPLRDTLNALSCADVASRVVEIESSSLKPKSQKRRRLIEKKRELAAAQKELLGEGGYNRPLMSADTLLDLSMQKFDARRETADKAECCFIGLAVCSGFDSFEDATDNAVKLWCRAIGADLGKWEQWLSTETDLTDSRLRDLILGDTVFGMLLKQTRDAGSSEPWKSVLFTNTRIENGVLATLDPSGSESGRKMQRLLCSVAKIQHAGT